MLRPQSRPCSQAWALPASSPGSLLATQNPGNVTGRPTTASRQPAPCVRVRLVVRVAPAALGDVRVELGRAEVGVAEHLLDAAEDGAALEQGRGERVAQEMRVDALRLEPGLRRQSTQDEERSRPCQRPALRVQEELGTMPAVEERTAAGGIPS